MPNANYNRGRRAEWKVRDLLLEDWPVVVRAAGSKGAIDLVALGKETYLAVQVKAGPHRPSVVGVGVNVPIATAWVKPGGEVEWL